MLLLRRSTPGRSGARARARLDYRSPCPTTAGHRLRSGSAAVGHAPAGGHRERRARRQAHSGRGRRGDAVALAAGCAQRAHRRTSHPGRLPRRARRAAGGVPRRRHAQRRGSRGRRGARESLLQRTGDPPPPEPLKAMVPVSMRRLGDTASGNQISMITIALPVHLDSASERLEWVRAQTKRLKQTDRPVGTHKLYQAAGLLPTQLRSTAAKAMANRGSSTSPSRNHPRHEGRCTSWAASSRRSTRSSPLPKATRSQSRWCATARSCFSAATPTRTRCRSPSAPRLIEAELQQLGRAPTGPRAGDAT